ncbi:ribonuclease Z, partial [bacterium]|nr:ribonuclease Z [bacterium]
CECSFLRNNREKARRSFHLCTDDLNYLCDKIQPEFIMPMHLSKSYLGKSNRLYEELSIPSTCTLLKLPERLQSMPMFPSDISLHS